MVITMAIVLMVQVAIDQVVDVVTMGNGFMATSRTVDMVSCMAAAIVTLRTISRVLGADFNDMLIDMTLVRVMKMTVMQVVDMVAMTHCSMSAVGAVLMVMVFVSNAFFFHFVLSFL
jgi:hypothetical protein